MGDKNNFRKKDSGKMKINIKRRYKYFRVHDFIMIICLLTIAMMSGAIAGEYIVDSSLPAYSNNSNNNSTKSDESTGTQNINAIKKVSSSLVTIAGSKEALDKNSYSAGNLTGIVYDKKGNIITNASKVKNMAKIYVKPSSVGTKVVEGKIIGINEVADIAVIRIEYDNLAPIEMNTKDDAKEGLNILAIGNAISDNYVGVATSGIVSSTNDFITDSQKKTRYYLLQTDAEVSDENTGGPICSVDGQMIGMISKNISDTMKKQNLYYAVTSKDVYAIVQELINERDVLGINGGREVEYDSTTKQTGVYVESLITDGYAAEAGIKANDIITSVGSFKVKTTEDIYEALQYKKSGDVVVCKVIRDNQEISVTITFK